MPYYCGRCGQDVTSEWAHWRDTRGLPVYPTSHKNWYMDRHGNWTHCLCCRCKFIYDIDHKIEELREVPERIEAAVAEHNQLMALMVWGEYFQLNEVRSSRTGQ